MTQDDRIRVIVVVLAFVSALAGVIAFVTWLANHPVVAAILLTLGGVSAIITLVVAAVGITAAWTRQTMIEGARIALESQNINDQWDAKKMAALATFGREVARQTGASLPRPSDVPALPMPGQGQAWLPALTEFSGDTWEIVDEDEAVT